MVQIGACWCRMLNEGTSYSTCWSRLGQEDGAGRCRYEQDGADWSRMVQDCAGLCRLVQNCAS